MYILLYFGSESYRSQSSASKGFRSITVHYGLPLKHFSGEMPTLLHVDNSWIVLDSLEFKEVAAAILCWVRASKSFWEEIMPSLSCNKVFTLAGSVIFAPMAANVSG
jgi:hypothetical protein